MSLSFFSAICTEPSGPQHYEELEAYLENEFSSLVAQHSLLRSFLISLIESEQQTAATSRFAMGITYLTAALVVSGYAIKDTDSAAVVLDVVERYLLLEGSIAYTQLRGHRCALQRLEQVLNGYITILESQDKANYSRKLHYLSRAVFLLAPSPEHLTVAHAPLVREAARSCCPAPALAIMRQPVLEISPADTGAGLACFYNYYCEGGLLFAALRCWGDAAEWLRAVVSPDLHARRVVALKSPADAAAGVNRNGKECDVVVRATKAFILVSIIHSGELLEAEDHRRVRRVVQRFCFGNVDPYLRLLAAATQRDGKQWLFLEAHFKSLWEHDGTAALVTEAGACLRRHVVHDIAKVASRVYLSEIIAVLRLHSLSIVCAVGEAMVEEDKEAAAVIELLLSVHHEGRMSVSLEYLACKEDEAKNTEKHGVVGGDEWKQVVICFSLLPQHSYRVLENSSYGFHALCLHDSDSNVKGRFEEAQIHRLIEERIQRCSRAFAALMRATEVVCGGNSQPVENCSDRKLL